MPETKRKKRERRLNKMQRDIAKAQQRREYAEEIKKSLDDGFNKFFIYPDSATKDS